MYKCTAARKENYWSNVGINRFAYYRTGDAYWSCRMEQEIPQTVGHQLVVMETMLLNHVRMRSNDDLHAKGHKMFCRTKLVGKSSSIMFMSEVDENYNDVDFSLSTIKNSNG